MAVCTSMYMHFARCLVTIVTKENVTVQKFNGKLKHTTIIWDFLPTRKKKVWAVARYQTRRRAFGLGNQPLNYWSGPFESFKLLSSVQEKIVRLSVSFYAHHTQQLSFREYLKYMYFARYSGLFVQAKGAVRVWLFHLGPCQNILHLRTFKNGHSHWNAWREMEGRIYHQQLLTIISTRK